MLLWRDEELRSRRQWGEIDAEDLSTLILASTILTSVVWRRIARDRDLERTEHGAALRPTLHGHRWT